MLARVKASIAYFLGNVFTLLIESENVQRLGGKTLLLTIKFGWFAGMI